MAQNNIVTAKFAEHQTAAWTQHLVQWDYGQVLRFEGLDLPEAYEVHFSNTPVAGETKTQIGNADGVTIPDEYLTSGESVYAFVYLHTGENDGETEYKITIPVTKRPRPSDEQPTPVEQSAIDQAIAALNIAVEKADEAIAHYPRIEDGTWHVWDVTEQAYVDTGVEAQGKQGEPGKDGEPGKNGEPGKDGEPGKNGISPAITVTDITDGHRVTITDAVGTKTFDVLNGEKGEPGTPGAPGAKGNPGDNGISPAVNVTEITGGHRVTITDASGEHTFDVMDGEDGSTVTVDSALSEDSENPVQNKVIAKEITDVKEDLNKKVDDVQINGSSILDDGVANIPIASQGKLGLVQYNSTYGVFANASGRLAIFSAQENEIKGGAIDRRPITPIYQHESTFYGLTKAAGVDMAQSANPVGTYTDEAKIAIQKMLGIYEAPWELIREDTFTNEEEADHIISVDGNGEPFELTDVLLVLAVPDHAEDTIIADYGRVYLYDENTNVKVIYLLNAQSKTVAANTIENTGIAQMTQEGQLVRTELYQWNSRTTRANKQIVYYDNEGSSIASYSTAISFLASPLKITSIKIGKITGQMRYRLFGKRKWQ